MKLAELYQEPLGGSFTHDKVEYDLNALFKLVDKDPIAYFNVTDLVWVLDEVSDEERVQQADLSAPILVTIWKHKWVVLDGAHRLQKAVAKKLNQLPGKFVSREQLQAIKLDKA